MSEKIYVGSGKKQNGNWLKVTVNPNKLKEHIQEFKGHEFVKLNINISDEPDQYGKDVQITVDQWKPEETLKRDDVAVEEKSEPVDNSDVPF